MYDVGLLQGEYLSNQLAELNYQKLCQDAEQAHLVSEAQGHRESPVVLALRKVFLKKSQASFKKEYASVLRNN